MGTELKKSKKGTNPLPTAPTQEETDKVVDDIQLASDLQEHLDNDPVNPNFVGNGKSPGLIYGKMINIMEDIGFIPKTKRNRDQNYNFRGIDDVLLALQPLLIKHRVFYVPRVTDKKQVDRVTQNGKTMIYTNLDVDYIFYAEDGSNVTASTVGEGMDMADKSSNKAMSAALKYLAIQVFCIPAEDIDDADATTPEATTAVQKSTGHSQPQPPPAQPFAAPPPQTKQQAKPPTAAPSSSNGGGITSQQERALGNIVQRLQLTPQDWEAELANYHCTSTGQLTQEQAGQLIVKLSSK